ncbi:type II methionyl aminopeptidase [Candidatus Pacearchaeota archaeon]|nr:type II methionyl aminopeptidase [Candidatus Pacearchaeota archaeon]
MEKEEFDKYVKAGKIAQEIKKFALEIVKPEMKLINIAEAIDAKIFELGGKPAFPLNLSLNECAAHFTPARGDEIIATGILKIDIGVAVDGFIADTALSIDLTEDKRFSEMMELNEQILADVTKVVKHGMEVKDVGNAAAISFEQWNKTHDSNFSIIKGLCGHSLAEYNIHAGLTISNYENGNTKKLDEMAFAIEPFVTTGDGDIYEGQPGGIYVLQNEGNVRDRDARKILEYIKETYSTLPFCSRWLDKEGFKKIRFSLSMMEKAGIIYQYPMLMEKSRAPVSQFENTFVIFDGKVANTTKVE